MSNKKAMDTLKRMRNLCDAMDSCALDMISLDIKPDAQYYGGLMMRVKLMEMRTHLEMAEHKLEEES